ncbi:MAG: Ig-like domain-containing protein [Christensenellaceae bacterium]
MLGFVACGKSESIKLSIESVATVEVGTSVVLEPTIEGGSAEDIEWSTENAALATVSGGVVTGVAPGTVKITAKLGEVSAVCEVTVKAAVTISWTLSANRWWKGTPQSDRRDRGQQGGGVSSGNADLAPWMTRNRNGY